VHQVVREALLHVLGGVHLSVILDLCGGTGAWSRPYREAGYEVILVDLPQDIRLLKAKNLPRAHGILAAPPCTVFSYARNRYPPTDDEFRAALSVVDACLRIVHLVQPVWWALENPRNKLRRYLGEPRHTFYHWQYGDDAHKPTCLWGEFVIPPFTPGPRRKPSTFKTSKENASPIDAITPARFARAFFEANP
jgi:hypothetical protein